VVPVTAPLLAPVSLFQTKDFGDYLMVRAANMKITMDKKDMKIVNISGGGCPDVPYLAQEMVGKTLAQAPRPGDLGHTLCGYALELAYEELLQNDRHRRYGPRSSIAPGSWKSPFDRRPY
jgi:hypothetical protein